MRKAPVDNEPTVKSLESRTVAVAPDSGIQADTAKAIAAYQAFLAAAPRDAQRPEAMRRLGDLEMESPTSACPQVSHPRRLPTARPPARTTIAPRSRATRTI